MNLTMNKKSWKNVWIDILPNPHDIVYRNKGVFFPFESSYRHQKVKLYENQWENVHENIIISYKAKDFT